jgi:plasmid maintenance system antidote protein VapI
VATLHPMTLQEYLSQPDALSPSALAKAVGCHKSFITRIRDKERQPSLSLAVKIEQATRGKVKAASMLMGA